MAVSTVCPKCRRATACKRRVVACTAVQSRRFPRLASKTLVSVQGLRERDGRRHQTCMHANERQAIRGASPLKAPEAPASDAASSHSLLAEVQASQLRAQRNVASSHAAQRLCHHVVDAQHIATCRLRLHHCNEPNAMPPCRRFPTHHDVHQPRRARPFPTRTKLHPHTGNWTKTECILLVCTPTMRAPTTHHLLHGAAAHMSAPIDPAGACPCARCNRASCQPHHPPCSLGPRHTQGWLASQQRRAAAAATPPSSDQSASYSSWLMSSALTGFPAKWRPCMALRALSAAAVSLNCT